MLKQMERLASLIGRGILTGGGAIQPDIRFSGSNIGMRAIYIHLKVYVLAMLFCCVELSLFLGNSSADGYSYSSSNSKFVHRRVYKNSREIRDTV